MAVRSFKQGFAVIVAGISAFHHAHGASFEIADAAEFNRIINTNAIFSTNANINVWLEGPTWIPAGGYLVFCDQNNNRLKKLVPPSTVTDFQLPPANTLFNGTLLDAQERLICAEAGSGGLRISMLTNGVVTPLATNWNGLKFYSPNDVAVKADGTIWFTDPGYNGGTTRPHAGYPSNYCVYQFHPTNANATCRPVITNGIIRPNGLCFSPDETKLYVADSEDTASGRRIYVCSVSAGNTITNSAVFASINNGVPDGIKCDADGRVWSSAGNGVHIFAPDGHVIGRIIFQRTANLCFGGPQYKTLYMTGQPLVTSMPVLVAGAPSLKRLEPSFDGNQMTVSWPAPSTGFNLEETERLDSSSSWSNSTLPVITQGNQKTMTVDTTNTTKFFRLRLN
jgi:gluconolactonase